MIYKAISNKHFQNFFDFNVILLGLHIVY